MSQEDISLETLGKHIQTHLYDAGIKTHVRELIQKIGSRSVNSSRKIVAEQILHTLQGKGILDDVIKTFNVTDSGKISDDERITEVNGSDDGTNPPDKNQHMLFARKIGKTVFSDGPKKISGGEQCDRKRTYRPQLQVEIKAGKAFLDYLLEEQIYSDNPTSWLTMFFYFRGQRRWIKPTASACEPQFNGCFTFELQVPDSGQLLTISDQIHIVLQKITSDRHRQLLSSQFVDWRQILVCPNSQKCFMVEFLGVGAENNIPVGIVEVKLSLAPTLIHLLPEKVIIAQRNLEKAERAKRHKIFLLYVKMWWRDYLSIKPEHSARPVKIFAQDENLQTRPVFSFLKVIYVGRPFLETPREAACFVSMIPLENSNTFGGLPFREEWSNVHTFLCCKKGGPENHALLLCSLLLGFGLNAFVCLGTKTDDSPWAWVLTQGNKKYVTFWESTTGIHYKHVNPETGETMCKEKADHNYKTIGCAFNNRKFYACVQKTNIVENCSFNFQKESEWKSMSMAAISSVNESEQHIPLVSGSLDTLQISRNMENDLRRIITGKRMDFNLSTQWDHNLEQYMAQLLASHEIAHRTGTSLIAEDFDEVINTNIPEGFGFKAQPLRVTDIPMRRIFGQCMRNPIVRDIIVSQEPDVRLVIRVSVYVYPENILSIWVLIGCKYRMK